MPSKQDRQTILFSATFADEVQKLAEEFLREYVWIGVGRTGSTVENITQKLELVNPGPDSKMDMLVPAIQATNGSTLVFVQQRKTASYVREWLQEHTDIVAEEIHGLRTQAQREAALRSFREGKIRVLVATDVAARGLDIPDVTHVIQFDLPFSAEDFDVYIHRIGRTGRAGNSGMATSFYTPGKEVNVGNGKIAPLIMRLLKENQQEIPEWFSALEEAQETIGARNHPQSNSKNFVQGGNNQAGARKNFSNAHFASRDIRRDYRTQTFYHQPVYPSNGGHVDSYQYYAPGMVAPMVPYMTPQPYGMAPYSVGQAQQMGYMAGYQAPVQAQQMYYQPNMVPVVSVNPAAPATPMVQVYKGPESGGRGVTPFPAQVGVHTAATGEETAGAKSPAKSPTRDSTGTGVSNISTPADRLTDVETDTSNMSIEVKDECSNRDSGTSNESSPGIAKRADSFASQSLGSPNRLQRNRTHPGNTFSRQSEGQPMPQYQQYPHHYQQAYPPQYPQQQQQQQQLQYNQYSQQQRKQGGSYTRPPVATRSRSADSDVTSSPGYKQSHPNPNLQQHPQHAPQSHGYPQQNSQPYAGYNAAVYSYASMPQTQPVMYTYENGVAHPVVYQQPGIPPGTVFVQPGYGSVAYGSADGAYSTPLPGQQPGQQPQGYAYYQPQAANSANRGVSSAPTGPAGPSMQRPQQPAATAYYNKMPVSRQTYGGRNSQSQQAAGTVVGADDSSGDPAAAATSPR